MSHLDDFLANYSNAHRDVPPDVRLSLLFKELAEAAKADIEGSDLVTEGLEPEQGAANPPKGEANT